MLVRLRLSVKERLVERKSGLRFVELKVAKTYRSGAHGPGQDLIEAEESFGKLLVEIIDFLLATTYGQFAPGASAADYADFRDAMEALLATEYAERVSDQGIRLERYVLLAVADKSR